ncbi:hypothetical protein [Halovenus salina]|uniref:Halobacterial output domain-containing protein n=1 Tax=Halovenus salina TaxID=1510225 RepID=A0ABD5W547_9EURY|nr:hypothetical protein [Halovenus salina]
MEHEKWKVDSGVDDCTTTGSFADHDINDGSTLLRRTYYRLAAANDTEYEPTAAFFDALESAFIWAYLSATEQSDIPDHVEAAIDDARAQTAGEFADRPGADLRTDVVPAFYNYAAGFHCAYRETRP